MQIQINTDKNIEGREALAEEVKAIVETALSRVNEQVTRIEVHLSNGDAASRGLVEMRCMMEARLEGRQPVAVTDQATTVMEAVSGAASKLARLLESTLAKLREQDLRRN